MYEIACRPKEAACIVGSLFSGLRPPCEHCLGEPEDKLTLLTDDGLEARGTPGLTLDGRSCGSGTHTTIKITADGLLIITGDADEINRIHETRCAYYGSVNTPKESRDTH